MAKSRIKKTPVATSGKKAAKSVAKKKAKEHPKVMLLTCIDYRYPHRIVDVMDKAGYRRDYDQLSLAGAAAGANHSSEWLTMFLDHIEIARSIDHPIEKVVILDHRDCGAYRAFGLLGPFGEVTPDDEKKAHESQVKMLIDCIKERFPEITVEAMLLTREEDDRLSN
jgi:carbonic anhydrase